MIQISHTDDLDREWQVASDVPGHRGPVVILPVSSILKSSPADVLDLIETLIPKAELANALQSAQWVNYNHSHMTKGRMKSAEINAEALLLKFERFSDEPEIQSAIDLIRMVIKLEAERIERKPKVARIRKEMVKNYNALFVQVGRKDGFHCQTCRATDNLQIDHIKPVSKGGENQISNLQLLCCGCNNTKSDKEVAHVG